ncbi:hypothetical protein N657DRAFT_686018 [Parathielavia appendiculata]|uniref:Cupin 2 conserved barrel domain-containing protein n=1 Tax=Parathielavia appendiculata TaxID=2587402 RepID=A0AAN6U991_9PEZI|nr:hypothetical protein N657DRAFT_686018 [Parathielavia appendiculata]
MPIRGPVHVKLHKKDAAETLRVGPLTIRVYEDGSLTENRVSGVLLRGSMTFVTPEGETTALAGDLMTVPPGAVHTFKNASETEDCEVYMTATPGHYVDYFRMLAKVTDAGKQLTSADVQHLMALFGTFPPNVESEP